MDEIPTFAVCALSQLPWKHPVCTEDGTVFELERILPYIQKHKKHPLTGEPCSASQLIRLHFSKSRPQGTLHCPITLKPFTCRSKVVCNRVTGNVYSLEAHNSINKARSGDLFLDPITEQSFRAKDLILINDPDRKQRKAKVSQLEIPREKALSSAVPFVPKERAEVSILVVFDKKEVKLRFHLLCDTAPIVCFNFLSLVQAGFYDGELAADEIVHDSMLSFGRGIRSIYKDPSIKRESTGGCLSFQSRLFLCTFPIGNDIISGEFAFISKPGISATNLCTIFGELQGHSFDIVPLLKGKLVKDFKITKILVEKNPWSAKIAERKRKLVEDSLPKAFDY